MSKPFSLKSFDLVQIVCGKKQRAGEWKLKKEKDGTAVPFPFPSFPPDSNRTVIDFKNKTKKKKGLFPSKGGTRIHILYYHILYVFLSVFSKQFG